MTAGSGYRVLFVDDEDRVLHGLRRQMRAHRDRWDFRFATGGEEALRMLSEEDADVVVSDMRMPGMSGIELLRAVRERWPGTLRIVLSGHTEHTESVTAVGCAHQFLQKPCPPEELVRTIERCRGSASLVHTPSLRDAVSAISSLPVVSDRYRELSAALEDPGFDAAGIARIVERDIGLTTKVLQLVNSAFFGMPRRVDSVREAVTLLGGSYLRAAVVSGSAFEALDAGSVCAPAMRSLWMSSMEIGRRAGLLACACGAGERVAARSRLAGMLSLVGRAVLMHSYWQVYSAPLLCEGGRSGSLGGLERGVFGVEQQVVGGYALGVWAFQEDIIDAVTYQSTPELHEPGGVACPLEFVHLARCCVTPGAYVERLSASPVVLGRLGLTAEGLLEASGRVAA
ncbi:MAG: HDOD domain-containing protein [Phycisphaerales bacterium JB040]